MGAAEIPQPIEMGLAYVFPGSSRARSAVGKATAPGGEWVLQKRIGRRARRGIINPAFAQIPPQLRHAPAEDGL